MQYAIYSVWQDRHPSILSLVRILMAEKIRLVIFYYCSEWSEKGWFGWLISPRQFKITIRGNEYILNSRLAY